MSDQPGPAHRFKVGQTVSMNPSMFERRAPRETFKVIKLLPIEGSSIPYRVKSTRDNHERVVEEGQLG